MGEASEQLAEMWLYLKIFNNNIIRRKGKSTAFNTSLGQLVYRDLSSGNI